MPSSSSFNSSNSFSPGRSPVYTMGISRSGSSPDKRIRSCATSTIFIGRDQHEVLDFELPRQVGSVIRSKDVVGNRLKAVLLHHGDMLIGCRMKHEMRAVSGHHVTQTVAIQNVSDQRGIIQPWEVLCEIDVDLVQVALRLVEKHQFPGFDVCYLARQFGADRPSRSRDQTNLALEFLPDPPE